MHSVHVLQGALARVAAISLAQKSATLSCTLQACNLDREALGAIHAEGRRLRKAASRHCFLVMCSDRLSQVASISTATTPAASRPVPTSNRAVCDNPRVAAAIETSQSLGSGVDRMATNMQTSNRLGSPRCPDSRRSPDDQAHMHKGAATSGVHTSGPTVATDTGINSVKDGGDALLARLKQRLCRVTIARQDEECISELSSPPADQVANIRKARHNETMQQLQRIQAELGHTVRFICAGGHKL
jgi:hypothetical protein